MPAIWYVLVVQKAAQIALVKCDLIAWADTLKLRMTEWFHCMLHLLTECLAHQYLRMLLVITISPCLYICCCWCIVSRHVLYAVVMKQFTSLFSLLTVTNLN